MKICGGGQVLMECNQGGIEYNVLLGLILHCLLRWPAALPAGLFSCSGRVTIINATFIPNANTNYRIPIHRQTHEYKPTNQSQRLIVATHLHCVKYYKPFMNVHV